MEKDKKLDYKKEYKVLYQPATKPSIIDVPEMIFIAVDGKGNPNTCEAYKEAMEILYGLSFTIKMSKMSGTQPEGYFEYVVPPLEGFWTVEGISFDGINVTDKDKFCWTSMIRQPEFVTEEVFEKAKEALMKKKPELAGAIEKARYRKIKEGLCVQMMHKGSYDDEPKSIEKMKQYVTEMGYEEDFSDTRFHHEIYLSDPRRCAPEKLRTVIRHPVRKAFPVLENEDFLLRVVRMEDAGDLLKVYSDEKAVPFFNSDNCNGDDFHYTTLERMKQAIDFWIYSYVNHYFVRWTIVDKQKNEAIGTIEFFNRQAEDFFHECGLLRLDIRSDYEQNEMIQNILQLFLLPMKELLGCKMIATKAIPTATERIAALQELGFVHTDEKLIGTDDKRAYGDYMILKWNSHMNTGGQHDF
ncbi:MAG: GNAT family N-acetyltransferase [Lachnospiraceae bacterium]|nr:GNAT family N-acetyltransferase [Lachnospiraceae bacterium]